MHEVIPGARVEGKVVIDGQDLYASDVDPVDVRRHIGMVFQRPNPFPTMSIYDNVAAGLRLNATKMKKSELDDLVERSLRGANLWAEVKDRLSRPGLEPVGRSAAAAVHRPRDRRRARRPPDGRAVLGARPHLDARHRGPDDGAEGALHDRHRHPNMQQAARVSESTGFFNLAGVGQPGRLVEFNSTEKIFSNPDEKSTEDYISGRFG